MKMLLMLCSAILALAVSTQAIAARYELHDLHTSGTEVADFAASITNSGNVLCWTSGWGAYVWTPGNRELDFGLLYGQRVMDMNNSNQVVGTWSQGGYPGSSSALRWDMINGLFWMPNTLKSLNNSAWSSTYAINDKGQVAGYSGGHAVMWDSDGSVTDLAGSIDEYWCATAINDMGLVALETVPWNDNSVCSVYLWDAIGGIRQLSLLPGTLKGHVYAINNSGQAVGKCDDRAVLWNSDGIRVDCLLYELT